MFQTIVNADGTISIVPVGQTNNLPFDVGNRLFNQFNNASVIPDILPNQTSFDPRSLQSIFPTNVQTGIMTQAPLQNLGFDTSLGVANEEDVEQVDYLGSKPNKFQEGIAKLFDLYQRFSPVAAIGRGIESIRDRINTRKAIERNIRSDPQGKITTYNLRSPSQIAQDKIDDRGRGQIPSRTTSAPKKSSSNAYSEAKRSFFR